MYLTLGRADPAPRITTETPGPVSPMALTRVLDPRTQEFGAVCRIYTALNPGYSVGSGVLITPRHVLTCAHVIQPPENPNRIKSITVFVAQNGPADGKHGIKANGWAVAPGWTAGCCRSYDEDYGLIRLSKPVTTGVWPAAPFDPRRLAGKTAYLAGYPVQPADFDAHFMYRSRGEIKGSMAIQWCRGNELRWSHGPHVDETTRLVWHLLDTRPKMSGGPMWSFVDNERVLWGLHAGKIDDTNKKAILLNKSVLGQIAHWISRVLPA